MASGLANRNERERYSSPPLCERCYACHNGNYGSGRFCSEKCARGFATAKVREKLNESMRVYEVIQCSFCSQEFKSKYGQKYCSVKCSVHNRPLIRTKTKMQLYRKACQFDFSLKDFPQEFDFTLNN